ncbi:MAG: RibD family protein [Candidatus Neomarinimicrobiota bacterium]
MEFCSFRFGADESVRINSFVDLHPDCHHVLVVGSESDTHPPERRNRYEACFQTGVLSDLEESDSGNLPQELLQFIKLYGPYCFAAQSSNRLRRSVAIVHFAQSLDGRIATTTGASRWIGNRENLHHAHRMRALCDGVLVGSATFSRDRPRLTVRHVSGRNPVRIVVGSSPKGLKGAMDISPDPVWLVGYEGEPINGDIEAVDAGRSKNGIIPGKAILRALYRKGLHSVYIEGGATTASHFIKDHTVDVLQLHISPMIVGSGKASFSLPAIEEIAEAKRFSAHRWFSMGDHIMFVGWFPHNEEGNSE